MALTFQSWWNSLPWAIVWTILQCMCPWPSVLLWQQGQTIEVILMIKQMWCMLHYSSYFPDNLHKHYCLDTKYSFYDQLLCLIYSKILLLMCHWLCMQSYLLIMSFNLSICIWIPSHDWQSVLWINYRMKEKTTGSCTRKKWTLSDFLLYSVYLLIRATCMLLPVCILPGVEF